MNKLKLERQGLWIANLEGDYAFAIEPQGGAVIDMQQRFELARRIVACVNSCSGASTELLEKGMRHDWAELMTDLERERDELLAALVALVADCDTGERGPDGKQRGVAMPRKEPVWAAHAAIARAKGGAA